MWRAWRYAWVSALSLGVLAGCVTDGSPSATTLATDSIAPVSSEATPLPSTASSAAQALFEAWQAHDRQAAQDVASESAVDNLWTTPPNGYVFNGTCKPAYCSFDNEPRFLAFYLVVNEKDHGFWVEEADAGTIESTIPPD